MLVVGNLPYSVSKPIVAALIEARAAIDEMALMLQREVAERAGSAARRQGRTGRSRSSRRPTATSSWRCACRPGAFRPPPQVDSAVVRLASCAEARVPPRLEARFREVVRAAFAPAPQDAGERAGGGLGLPLGRCARPPPRAGVDPGRRAETLSIEEFVALAHARLS